MIVKKLRKPLTIVPRIVEQQKKTQFSELI